MNDCVIDRYNDVSRYCWSYAEGDHFVGSIDDEDQDHCSTWAKILGVDRRIDSGFAVDLSTDVDLETGVWWIRSINRSPQMLLIRFLTHSIVLCSTLCARVYFSYVVNRSPSVSWLLIDALLLSFIPFCHSIHCLYHIKPLGWNILRKKFFTIFTPFSDARKYQKNAHEAKKLQPRRKYQTLLTWTEDDRI